MPASKPPRVEIVSRSVRPPLPASRCRRLLERLARLLERRDGRRPAVRRWNRGRAGQPRLTVLFAGDATMRALNARFLGHDRPTDVLSFPACTSHRSAASPEGPYLGDVAIGVPAARRQARRRGHSLGREIEILLVHGYLHLLGYDHERDGGEMSRLEARLRRRLRLSGRRSVA